MSDHPPAARNSQPPRLYLITDRTRTAGRPLLSVIEDALRAGVDTVQLREKDLPASQLFDLASQLCALCRRYGARVLINDRIDIALAVRADGAHLPANSFAPADARCLLGPAAVIGVSTHSLAEVHAAARAGADFVVFGPVFDTPSKRAFGAPAGLDTLGRAARESTVAVLAIGGITPELAAPVRRCGAHGVAVVSGILSAADPCAATKAFRAALLLDSR